MPDWKEAMIFTIAGAKGELRIKIYDDDSGTTDDYVRELT